MQVNNLHSRVKIFWVPEVMASKAFFKLYFVRKKANDVLASVALIGLQIFLPISFFGGGFCQQTAL